MIRQRRPVADHVTVDVQKAYAQASPGDSITSKQAFSKKKKKIMQRAGKTGFIYFFLISLRTNEFWREFLSPVSTHSVKRKYAERRDRQVLFISV